MKGKRRAVTTIGGVLGVLWMMNHPVPALAAPLCEHRSAAHAAEHHQTREEDSRHHVLRGELPTCGLEDKSQEKHDESNDSDGRWHRDRRGFHCGLFGCG